MTLNKDVSKMSERELRAEVLELRERLERYHPKVLYAFDGEKDSWIDDVEDWLGAKDDGAE